MDIVLNRKGGVPVREQLVTQLELQILEGRLQPGQRLPSVRALARRLNLHHNTVSAAYQDLEAAGHVDLRKGSGVFVRPGGPSSVQDARGLDEIIRMALYTAFRKGFTGAEIRAAVERWLAAAPPDRIVIVDPVREMAELLARELTDSLRVRTLCCAPEEVARDPACLSGALAVCLPYHVDTLKRLAPGAALEAVTLQVSDADRQIVEKLPAGSVLLVVTSSPTVVRFATNFFRSLRGDEVLVEARLLSERRDWRRLMRAADLVMTDALSFEEVRKGGARRVREVRIVAPDALARLREALSVVTPRGISTPRPSQSA